MPTCRKCNAHFPNRLEIEGKVRNLYKRKYCLECSPWGKHNTSAFLHLGSSKDAERQCIFCDRSFVNNKGGKGRVCGSCHANHRRFKVKNKCIQYKGGCCSSCGYSKCQAALVFHHLDPAKKDFNFGGAHSRSWESLREELDKCILLCQNCHSELHWEEGREGREILEKRRLEFGFEE